ncbi:MAG TPA: aldehyde dehydrogenase family protein [Phycisphaerales bacterium]|nr:aldehyde dehydrogenase family protein [Phycisphaerales bacterium]
MADRLEVAKTYKLYIDGKFPRSESGRTFAVNDARGRIAAHMCRASRKDVRDAVSAARKALNGWRDATAYLRAQIMYRMAEMMEGKRDEFAAALSAGGSPARAAQMEVTAAIDRLVAFAGWADKYAQVLGCNNQVAGPYYNFTVPEPTGVVAIIAPDEPGLLGLISLVAPVVCAGNTCVALGGGGTGASLATVILGEVMATSDVPGGVVNLLTGDRAELIPIVAGHRDIDAIHAAGVTPEQRLALREGAAENVKRVTVRDLAGKTNRPMKKGSARPIDLFDAEACESPWWIEPFVEMKTIWHPSAT